MTSSASGKIWLTALQWMKAIFARQQRIATQPLAEILPRTTPARLRSFLLDFDQEGKPVDATLDILFAELDTQWRTFDKR